MLYITFLAAEAEGEYLKVSPSIMAPPKLHQKLKNPAKTYNTRDSLVVTDPTTDLALTRLTRGERTGSRIFARIWSYVKGQSRRAYDILKEELLVELPLLPAQMKQPLRLAGNHFRHFRGRTCLYYVDTVSHGSSVTNYVGTPGVGLQVSS
jgi:hypothetical protein